MNPVEESDLVELFRAFLARYPSMRLGQAACAIASWQNQEPAEMSDESYISMLSAKLDGVSHDSSRDVGNSSMSSELAAVLREIRRAEPTLTFGQLLASSVQQNHGSCYDIENDDLLHVLRSNPACSLLLHCSENHSPNETAFQ